VTFKFEKLDVWQYALQYLELVYKVAESLPRSEEYNLKSQIIRAATSIALNIAEGSTGQTDAEQARFLGLAIRSAIETVACQHIISRQELSQDKTLLRQAYKDATRLVKMLQTMRNTLVPQQNWIREQPSAYDVLEESTDPMC
jgi:four helix bundle protein